MTTTILEGTLPDDLRRAVLKSGSGHKFDHGAALVLTGGFGRTGAARLAARACLRIGAGLVTCAAPGSALLECATQLTAVMLRRCDGGADLLALLDDRRFNALCLGPGLGLDERAAGLLDVALASKRAAVLDADALTLLSRRADPFAGLHDRCVLTPHGGEFARLFPDLAAQAETDKPRAVRNAAERAGCVVLLKGAETAVAKPDGRTWLHRADGDRAVPWLATAGAGDVLAGLIAGLLARGGTPAEATVASVWLHVEAAVRVGPGLIAEDLPEALPAVLRALRPD
ncbi:NAD(P)H-hydrate dehydratase [Jannaschia marina]|uniref:NAD(P)H-hydrate dehydratase n=1 Tax=Jannaschia marina TaxID=2741674 RepID=UPI002E28E3A2|nr:NAD(P)H-hydrate dehydratase [Jannaschia marina]